MRCSGAGAAAWAQKYRNALASEVIAAVVKVMSGEELSGVARALSNPLGLPRRRLAAAFWFADPAEQPGRRRRGNSVLVLEAVVRLWRRHPRAESRGGRPRHHRQARAAARTDVVRRLDLPTRYCVLSDIVKQHEARQRSASTSVSRAWPGRRGRLRAWSVSTSTAARSRPRLRRPYFETGQGSAVTNGTAEDVDMVTLKRAPTGLPASHSCSISTSRWMIVNDVAGFIGPEVFRAPEQLGRGVPRGYGHGQAAWAHDGARCVRHVPHGHCPRALRRSRHVWWPVRRRPT